MEVLNAAATPPFSMYKVAESRHGLRIRFLANHPFIFHRKKADSNYQQRPSFPLNHAEPNLSSAKKWSFNTYSTVLSTLFAPALASALTYEEALREAGGSSLNEAAADFDFNAITDAVVNFSRENPVAVLAGVVLVAAPLVLGQILQKAKAWGTVSARDAYSKLQAEAEAQLLDIRPIQDIREAGSPDLRSLKKRAVQVTYGGEDASFLKKVLAKFKDPANTTVYILDKFDGNSATVAKLLADNGFKSVFAIKDGAEGSKGWQNSRLPWLIPKKTLAVDFGTLKEVINSTIEENPSLVPVTVGVAAAAAVIGLAALSEIETALQLVGSAALFQVFVKKFLFAEDRKRTLQQLQDFLDTKVAPKEFVDELSDVGKALLPKTVDVTANTSADTTQKIDDSVTIIANAEVTGNSAPQPALVESVTTVSSVAAEGSSLPRPLSPYPHYPDFKPPTSPTPSRP